MEHLLFLTQRIPYPPDKGDKIRGWRILRHLAERYHVHLGCFYDAAEDARHVEFLSTICASLCCRRLRPGLAKLRSLARFRPGAALTLGYFEDAALRRWVEATLAAHRPSRIFVFCSAMAPYVLDYRAGVRVLDMVDVDSDKWQQYAASKTWPLSAIYARESRTLLQFERRIAAEFDATLLVSPAETALFRSLAPEAAGRVRCMPNGIDTVYFDPGRAYDNPFPPGRPVVVFTGAMDYWPNVQAVCWFAQEVMPLLRARDAGVEFWIVGTNPAAAARRLGREPGIVVTGRVSDIRPYLAHADAVVAPLQIARGVQNKVLEGMAMARPVVATPEACNGVAVREGEELLVARGARDFAEQVHAVLAGASRHLGRQARARAVKDYQWNFTMLDLLMSEREPAVIGAGGS
jgi:sugar transferase (PEP-CTERM/EpsH1 system associated)